MNSMYNRPVDPFGSMQGLMGQFQNFMQNPTQFFISKNLRVPQSLQNDPQGMVQYLLNNGTMTQDQLSQLQSMANRVQNNPLFTNMFRR